MVDPLNLEAGELKLSQRDGNVIIKLEWDEGNSNIELPLDPETAMRIAAQIMRLASRALSIVFLQDEP